jgi:hypothetical protein
MKDAELWEQAKNAEYAAISSMGVYELCDAPEFSLRRENGSTLQRRAHQEAGPTGEYPSIQIWMCGFWL